LLPGLDLETQPVFSNEDYFCLVEQKLPLGTSFEAPPLFDHYGDNDEDVEVFFEEKGISIQPSNESESFYQEQHDKDKDPSIDIHEANSCHQIADVIGEEKGEVDQ
jgi:hypothetical protein